MQARVDQIKKDISVGVTSKLTAEILAVARSKRDAAVDRMTTFLHRRESVFCFEAKMKAKLPVTSVVPSIVRYLDLYEQMKREKELALLCCHKKVCC